MKRSPKWTTDEEIGLGHLDRREVKIIANGALHPPRTVTGGAMTLGAPATMARVGLG